MIKKWLKKKFKQWSIEAWNSAQDNGKLVGSAYPTNYATVDADGINSNCIKFTVTPANGGVIISAYNFNNVKGESNTNLYVIHQNDDVSENITKIITLELLKKQ